MTQTTVLPRAIAIDEFMPMIGQVLLADCTPKAAELVLVSVTPHPPQLSARVPFTLVLRSSADIQLVGGTYALRCGDFGPDAVYLEPMLPPQDAAPGNYYQAPFN